MNVPLQTHTTYLEVVREVMTRTLQQCPAIDMHDVCIQLPQTTVEILYEYSGTSHIQTFMIPAQTIHFRSGTPLFFYIDWDPNYIHTLTQM